MMITSFKLCGKAHRFDYFISKYEAWWRTVWNSAWILRYEWDICSVEILSFEIVLEIIKESCDQAHAWYSDGEMSVAGFWQVCSYVIQHSNVIHRTYSLCYRVRPLNNKELKNGDQSVIQYPGNGQILVRSF